MRVKKTAVSYRTIIIKLPPPDAHLTQAATRTVCTHSGASSSPFPLSSQARFITALQPPLQVASLQTNCSTRLVQSQRDNVRVDHAQIERREEEIRVGQRDEHGAVDSWVALVDLASRLVRVPSILARAHQRRVREVQLRHPGDELRGARRRRGHVRVVGSDGLPGRIPGEVYLAAGEGQGLGAVARDGRAAVVPGDVEVDAGLVGGDVGARRVRGAVADHLPGSGVVGGEAVGVGLVGDVQGGEVLPCETRGVLRAHGNVRREVGPCP